MNNKEEADNRLLPLNYFLMKKLQGRVKTLPYVIYFVMHSSNEPGEPSGVSITTNLSDSYCLQAHAWLSTCRPERLRLP